MNVEQPWSILYMEDDPGMARLVEKAMKRDGHAVRIAPDGAEGVQILMDGELFHVVLMDYNMPVKNGLEVLQTLQGEGAVPPIIMLTGAGDESVAVEAMKLGAADYVVKDPDAGYLKLLPTVIQRVLEQRAMLEAKRKWEAEREKLIAELQAALAQVKTLSGLLPICASCKKIRDDTGYWTQLETFVMEHSNAEFSHSLCSECVEKLYPELADHVNQEIDEKKTNV